MAHGLELVRQAQMVLNALDRDESYAWNPEQGFLVCIPENNSVRVYVRYSSGYIARELARVRGGKHDGENLAFWISQALHYGIKPGLDQEKIQRDFEHKLTIENGRLTVPTRLLSLSQRIQDQAQSASLETEIKQEEDESLGIPAEKDHEQVTGNSECELRRRREGSVRPPPPVRQNPSSRGDDSGHGNQNGASDDGGAKPEKNQSLDLAATAPKSLLQAPTRTPKQTCQDSSFIQRSGGKATTATSTLAHRTRLTQPQQPHLEVIVPSQFADAGSYFTATPSPIPPTGIEPSKKLRQKSRHSGHRSHAVNRRRSGNNKSHKNRNMGAGLSHETSDGDGASSISQLANGSSLTHWETNRPQQGNENVTSQQDVSSHPANTNDGRAKANRASSKHPTDQSRSRGSSQPQISGSNGVRGPPRSKTCSRKESRAHSVVETEAPSDEAEELAQLQEALKISAHTAQVNSQSTAGINSRKGRSWQDYLREHPHKPRPGLFYPEGWQSNLAKYPDMPHILKDIRSRLGRGLYSDTSIQFCIELADGDPNLAYWNFVDAAGIKDVYHPPMGVYNNHETRLSLGRAASTSDRLEFGTNHTETATPQPCLTSQSSRWDELDLSGQTLVPSGEAIEQHHGNADNNDAHHDAQIAIPRPSLTTMASQPRPWRSEDQMDIGVLYHAESQHRGFYVRTHDSLVQHMFPMNALQSAWKKIEEQESLMKALGVDVPPHVGYDHRAKRRKERREYVGKNSASEVDLGPMNGATTVLLHDHPRANVSYEGHTNIPWQIQAMKEKSNRPNQAEKPAEQAAGSDSIERDESSGSQSPDRPDQVNRPTQPAAETILAQHPNKGKRKRAAVEASSTSGNDSSMATFRESVKKRKSTRGQHSSTLSNARLSARPAAETSSAVKLAHRSRATAPGSNHSLTPDDRPTPNGPAASRASALATAADNTIAAVSPSPGAPESTESTEWECRWEDCPSKYGTLKELYDHVRVVHVGYKLNGNLCLRCLWDECQSELSSADSAVRHILQHVPYAPHACDRCGKAYPTRPKLRDHLCQPTGILSNGSDSFDDVSATTLSASQLKGLSEAHLSSSVPIGHVELDHSDGSEGAELEQAQGLPRRRSSQENADQTPVSPMQSESTPSDRIAAHTNALSAINGDNGTTQQHTMAAKPSRSAKSSAQTQLRVGRAQRESLTARLQASGNDDVEDVRNDLKRVARKIEAAKKVVAQESADRRKKRGKSRRPKARKEKDKDKTMN